MSNQATQITNEVAQYLARQKAFAPTVYRTQVFAVLEDRHQWNSKDGRCLTVEVMSKAAEQAGGTYINDNGRARVVFA